MMPDTTRTHLPLLVEIDGALLRTTLTMEQWFAAVSHDLPATLRAQRRPQARLFDIAHPDPAYLPYRPEVLKLIDEARAAGRPVLLFSQAEAPMVQAIAAHLGLPGPHLAEGSVTAHAEQSAPDSFDLVARDRPDSPPFAKARQVVTVAAAEQPAGRRTPVIGRHWQLASLWRELRPHQWVKNLLLLVPLISAQAFGWAVLAPTLVAMLAFCAGASAIYVLNDLLDLRVDRIHPEKRHRPIASGLLPIRVAIPASLLLILLSLCLALSVSWGVAALMAGYMALSLLYSMRLKALRWFDIVVLVALYMMRVVTGAAAGGIVISTWLGLFICCVFLTLAAVKRLTGLARVQGRDHLPGRGYSLSDLDNLHGIALVGVVGTCASFGAYTLTAQASQQYSHPWLLASAAIPMAIWLMRMIRLSLTGTQDYDPILFVARDRIGQGIMLVGFLLFLVAH